MWSTDNNAFLNLHVPGVLLASFLNARAFKDDKAVIVAINEWTE